jgi:hypothetical protein
MKLHISWTAGRGDVRWQDCLALLLRTGLRGNVLPGRCAPGGGACCGGPASGGPATDGDEEEEYARIELFGGGEALETRVRELLWPALQAHFGLCCAFVETPTFSGCIFDLGRPSLCPRRRATGGAGE